MAMKPKFTLKLLIDEEQNIVVPAETCKDFADVLCSLLTLPMGTIVRLLEKHQNPQSSSTVGCFHNLYKSVSDMDVDNFKTPGCKHLLMYPRSVKESHFRKLKLNVDDTEATKFFVCPNFVSVESCCKVYSSVSTSRCSCGNSMTREFQVEDDGEEEDKVDGGVFLSCRTSYIVTDDMKVAVNSMGLVLNVLNGLGYSGFGKLQEMVIDVGFEEVLTLLGCLFTSDAHAPLTDTFLKKHCMPRKSKVLTPLVQESRVSGEVNEVVTLKVYIRKSDKAILYAECREEFVDFLVIPLEFAWDLFVDHLKMGCVGNLCRSVNELRFEQRKEAMLPYYYSCRTQLLDLVIQETPEYECLVSRRSYNSSRLSKNIKKSVLGDGERIAKLTPVVTSDSASIGLVKGETNFIVSDDLVITVMNSSSTISLLSKLHMNISDIEEQVISIGKAQAISLLRASLITTSALSNGLSSFLSEMKLKEAAPSTFKIPKSEKILRSKRTFVILKVLSTLQSNFFSLSL